MIYSLSFMVFIFGIFFLSRPLLLFVHEMGHALPSLWLTREPVEVFLGTYGDQEHSRALRLGRLTIWIAKRNIFWLKGLCRHFAVPGWRGVWITLGGPLASLGTGMIAVWFCFAVLPSGIWQFVGVVFAVSAAIDFYMNMIFNPEPVFLLEDQAVYSDGTSLTLQLRWKKINRVRDQFFKFCEEKKWEEAADYYDQKGEWLWWNVLACRSAMWACFSCGRFYKALLGSIQLSRRFSAGPDDKALGAVCLLYLGEEEEGLKAADEILESNPGHGLTLQILGFYYTVTLRAEKVTRAMLEELKKESPERAYDRATLGLATALLGNEKEGLQLISQAFQQDPSEANSFYCLGLFRLHQNQPGEALTLFEKAKTLRPFTPFIDVCIEKAKQQLQLSSR